VNTKNYKNKRKEGKKIHAANKAHVLSVLEGTGEANKRNKARKFYTIARGVKAGFQLQDVEKDLQEINVKRW